MLGMVLRAQGSEMDKTCGGAASRVDTSGPEPLGWKGDRWALQEVGAGLWAGWVWSHTETTEHRTRILAPGAGKVRGVLANRGASLRGQRKLKTPLY